MIKEDLEAIFDRVRSWPPQKQRKASNVLLVLEELDESLFPLSEEDRLELLAAVEEMERGEIASPEEVAELFRLRRA